MRVLITGCGGFLGRSIALACLQRGYAVRGFARRAYPELSEIGVEMLQGNVSNAEQVASAMSPLDGQALDAVFHVAARVGGWGSFDGYYQTNVIGTENVIAGCLEHRIRRLIFTSSTSVVHHRGDAEGIDEQVGYPVRFAAHYPRTKALAEQRVLEADSTSWSNGDGQLQTIALRPHMIWGPGDTQMLPRTLERARAGKLRSITGPVKKVDSVYIDNARDAHLCALEKLVPGASCAGKAFFISNGEPWPINELMAAVLMSAGVSLPTRSVSPGALHAAGCLSEAVSLMLGRESEPAITRFVARQLTSSHWFDISAAKTELGNQPAVSIEEGLKRLKAEFQQRELGPEGSQG